MPIDLMVNGKPYEVQDSITAGSLLAALGLGRRGVAIALNEAILPRSEWDEHLLANGDRIEIVTAAAGG